MTNPISAAAASSVGAAGAPVPRTSGKFADYLQQAQQTATSESEETLQPLGTENPKLKAAAEPKSSARSRRVESEINTQEIALPDQPDIVFPTLTPPAASVPVDQPGPADLQAAPAHPAAHGTETMVNVPGPAELTVVVAGGGVKSQGSRDIATGATVAPRLAVSSEPMSRVFGSDEAFTSETLGVDSSQSREGTSAIAEDSIPEDKTSAIPDRIQATLFPPEKVEPFEIESEPVWSTGLAPRLPGEASLEGGHAQVPANVPSFEEAKAATKAPVQNSDVCTVEAGESLSSLSTRFNIAPIEEAATEKTTETKERAGSTARTKSIASPNSERAASSQPEAWSTHTKEDVKPPVIEAQTTPHPENSLNPKPRDSHANSVESTADVAVVPAPIGPASNSEPRISAVAVSASAGASSPTPDTPFRQPTRDLSVHPAVDSVMPPTSVAVVHEARLMDHASQAEMHIGLRSAIFGSVEVHAVVRDSQVGLAIGSERGDLHRLMASEIPVIEGKLQQSNLQLDAVKFFDQGLSFDAGLGTGADPRSHTFVQSGAPGELPQSPECEPETADSPILLETRGGLNVRA